MKSNLSALKTVAENIISQAGDKRIVLFNGEMGAGKTTLIKEICLLLGVNENISSPTFSIVNTYDGKEGVVYHFDAYRLEEEEEAYDIGVEEYLNSGDWCLVEWPDKISGLLPKPNEMMEVNIEVGLDSRNYIIR